MKKKPSKNCGTLYSNNYYSTSDLNLNQKKEDLINKISPTILSIAGRHPGILKVKIIYIYKN